jgi:hypothetical protein
VQQRLGALDPQVLEIRHGRLAQHGGETALQRAFFRGQGARGGFQRKAALEVRAGRDAGVQGVSMRDSSSCTCG